MAILTQTVVGKGTLNSLIVEGMLKILRDLIPHFSLKFLTNSLSWNGRTTKSCIHFPNEVKYVSSKAHHASFDDD